MKNSLMIGIFAMLASCAPAHAGEINDKPIMCGSLDETMRAIGTKNERKMFEGIQLTTVRDPDAENGIRDFPAMLPVAFYMNLEEKTYTIVEYHPTYEQYCLVSFGSALVPVPYE
tara:strand:+ start:233 stop:577 length:345 start_codon:yes stop_codon:yes gene_type:complete